MDIDVEQVSFFNGDIRLAGRLYTPQGAEKCPGMVVLHAASAGLHSDACYAHLAARLPEAGVAVLLYDRRGSGESQGDFETTSFESLAADGMAALDTLAGRAEVDAARLGVYGISQGGWIAPIIAARWAGLAFQVIVSGSGVTPAEQMNYSAEFSLREAGFGEGDVRRALALGSLVNAYYRGSISRRELVNAMAAHEDAPWFEAAYLDPSDQIPADVTTSKWYYQFDHDPLDVWGRLNCPTLFLFAEQDRWVPVGASLRNYRRVTQHMTDATFERIPGADHMMYTRGDAGGSEISSLYLKSLMEWLRSRLGLQDGRSHVSS